MKTYFGGVPTQVDVRKLSEAFGVLQVGRHFTHEEVEALLGLKRTSNRYRTVTDAWRRGALLFGTDIGAVPGEGFRVLTDAERVDSGVAGFKQGTRKQMRSINRAARVNTEDPQLCKKQELLHRYGAAVKAQANQMLREINPPKPAPQISNQRKKPVGVG